MKRVRPKRRFRLKGLDIDRVDLISGDPANAILDENGNVVPLSRIMIHKSADPPSANLPRNAMDELESSLYRVSKAVVDGLKNADVFTDDAEVDDFLDLLSEEDISELVSIIQELGFSVSPSGEPVARVAPSAAPKSAPRKPTPGERKGIDPYAPGMEALAKSASAPETVKQFIERLVAERAERVQAQDVSKSLEEIRADLWLSEPGQSLFAATRDLRANEPVGKIAKSADQPEVIAKALDLLAGW